MKFEEGEYVSTTWEHFEEAKGDLYALPSHTARREASPGSRRGCNGDGGALTRVSGARVPTSGLARIVAADINISLTSREDHFTFVSI